MQNYLWQSKKREIIKLPVANDSSNGCSKETSMCDVEYAITSNINGDSASTTKYKLWIMYKYNYIYLDQWFYRYHKMHK